MTNAVDRALAHLDASWNSHIEDLKDLVRIPGISADPPPNPALEKSAKAVADLMKKAGLENCEVIHFPGGHPYAYGEWLHAPGAPTLLLYGHHDVQPPGREEYWKTPAFEPVLREDGRLYGRGAVDDKAGVMVHIAAIDAYLKTGGKLPVNVKFIVEGEEEAGSQSLEAFLEKYKAKLQADVIVLTDTANLEAGLPSLTVSLRGIVAIQVEVKSLDHPVHSGMFGGPVPDAVIALSKAIGALVDADGKLIESACAGVRKLTKEEHDALAKLPFNEEKFREEVGMVPGASFTGNKNTPIYGRIWREPAVAVIAFEARPIKGSSNQIIESARARISVRIVPDQDPKVVQDALVEHFKKNVPWNLEVNIEREAANTWWMTTPDHKAFAAAARAMKAGYGKDAVHIGCGGSIPFVDPFANVLGGAPALLMGVEDPICNAHGENESLNMDDFKKGTKAAIFLYDELSK